MAEELRIRVVFETDSARKGADEVAKSSQVVSNSISGMRKRVQDLEKAWMNAKDGTEAQILAYKEWLSATNQVNANMLRLNSRMQGSTRTTASMTMALQSMNFTVRDAPYLFRDFSLGILAIGNNLNPLIDNLIRVKQEATSVGMTMRQSLVQALTGANGAIFAFSILVTVIQAVTFQLAKKKQETKESALELENFIDVAKEAGDRLLDFERKVRKLSLRELTLAIKGVREEIYELNYEYGKFSDSLSPQYQMLINVAKALGILGYTADEYREKLEKLRDALKVAELDLQKFKTALEGFEQGYTTGLEFDYAPSELASFRSKIEDLLDVPESVTQIEIDLGDEKIVKSRASLEAFLKVLQEVNSESKKKPDGIIGVLKEQIKLAKERLEWAKTQNEIDEITLEIKEKQAELDRRLGKQAQEKYITTMQELTAQIARLEVLRKQTDNYYNQLLYSREIANLQEKLASYNLMKAMEEAEAQGRLSPQEFDLSQIQKQLKEGELYLDVKLQPVDMNEYVDEFETSIKGARKQEQVRMKEEVDDINKMMRLTDQVATTVGNSLYQAFLQGKLGADELLKSLIALIGQLVIIEGLKYIFSGGMSGLFASRGAVAGASRGRAVGLSVGGVSTFDSNATYDSIPVDLAPQEMVLNRRQTLSLFNAIRSGDFSSIGGSRSQQVRITGTLEARKNKFVVDFERAKIDYLNKVVGNVDNS